MALASIAPEDDDGNAASGQAAPPRRQEPPPPPPKRWSDNERKAFCAELDKLGAKYDEVAGWCESMGRPRPSAMEPAQRSALLQHLIGPGAAKFAAFVGGAK